MYREHFLQEPLLESLRRLSTGASSREPPLCTEQRLPGKRTQRRLFTKMNSFIKNTFSCVYRAAPPGKESLSKEQAERSHEYAHAALC